MRKLFTAALSFIVVASSAQTKLMCVVKDAFNNQSIIANITVNHQLKTTTDSLGVFSINVNENDTVVIAAASYQSKYIIINLKELPAEILLEANFYQPNNIQTEGLLVSKNNFLTPGSVYTITASEKDRGNTVFAQNYFNLVPGVRMESRGPTATGARIIMRGFGSQNPNAGNGYKAYLNNIPLTDADGTTILDDVDFDNLARIEFSKGPQGSVYGTGIGGEVQMYHKKADDGKNFGQSFMAGSNGLIKTNTYAGSATEKSNIRINYGHQQYDGYRMHSESKKDFVDVNADVVSDAKRSVSFYAGYTKSFDLLAGALDSTDNHDSPDSADLAYINTHAYQDIESARMSIEQEYKFSEKFKNITSVFVSTQTITQNIPGNLSKFNKNKFGARTLFVYTPMFGKRQARIIAGAEAIKNINYQKTYNENATGVLGTLKTDAEIRPLMWNVFTELNLQLDKYVSITAGAAANYNSYDVSDLRVSTNSPLYVNNSGIKHFEPLITTHVAINRNFGEHNLYLNYNESYSLPTADQVFITRLGRVTDTTQPEKGACFEIGIKGNLFKKAFNYQFAFYTLEITNRLTPQGVAATTTAPIVPAYFYYINLYNARNNGVEFAANYAYMPKSKSPLNALRLFLNYTYNHFYNADYKSDNNNNANTKDYTNLQVSGVAPHVVSTGFDVLLNSGFYASFTHYYSAKVPLNLTATSFGDAFNLSSAKIGWKILRVEDVQNHHIHVDIFAGVDNMFSHANPQMYFVNATAISPQLPKYFSPANPNATFYSGINLSYSF